MAVTLRYFTEFGKHTFQHKTAASSCGGIYAGVYCILYHVYDIVVKKVHVRYLISWWVSCVSCFLCFSGLCLVTRKQTGAQIINIYTVSQKTSNQDCWTLRNIIGCLPLTGQTLFYDWGVTLFVVARVYCTSCNTLSWFKSAFELHIKSQRFPFLFLSLLSSTCLHVHV